MEDAKGRTDRGQVDQRGGSLRSEDWHVTAARAAHAGHQGIDEDSIKILGRALDLSADEQRKFLRQQAAGDEARYEQLVRLLRWSEVDRKSQTAGTEISSSLPNSEQLKQAWAKALEIIRSSGQRPGSLRPGEEIAKGGMGVVQEAWDPVLERTVAIKRLRDDEPKPHPDLSDRYHSILLRFVEEARITAELDHPGIVPVHALGLDQDGQVYFSMRRVRGLDLSTVFGHVRDGREDWSTTKVLGVLQRACEAMAYAHSKGVVHRDLKPANIMVGRFGEVHVMDWGVARVLNRSADEPREHASAETGHFPASRSDARNETGSDSASSLLTQEGDVLGTPSYMSPEQARGSIAELGPRSDVYSMGAMLYHLLAGRAPYAKKPRAKAHKILERLLEGPPASLHEVAAGSGEELISICEKAMARDPAQRYEDMGEMSRDLSAFLEGRVVRAHRVGALVELRKWILRNRRFAAALAALIVVVPLAIGAVALVENRRAQETQLQADKDAAYRLVQDFVTLGPVGAQGLESRQSWVREVEAILERVELHQAVLDDLRSKGSAREDPMAALPGDELAQLNNLAFLIAERGELVEQARVELENPSLSRSKRGSLTPRYELLASDLAEKTKELQSLEARSRRAFTHEFTDQRMQRQHDDLVRFFDQIEIFDEPEHGLLARARGEMERGAALEFDTITQHIEAWDKTRGMIADRERSPYYDGLELPAIPGLVPLGQDPESGLQEFWHVLSGSRPERNSEGTYAIGPDQGMVFVLVPGGECNMTIPGSYPPKQISIDLAPYLISKFEMTQEQWKLLTGKNPSALFTGYDTTQDGLIFPGHPVETISWMETNLELPRWSLAIPTSAQWEFAVQGGDPKSSWHGTDFFSRLMVNTYNQGLDIDVPEGYEVQADEDIDRHILHATVGSYPPNPYGLHETLGNVSEFSAEWILRATEGISVRPGDGYISGKGYQFERHHQGGSWRTIFQSTTQRQITAIPPDVSYPHVGIRPSFPVDLEGHSPAPPR